MFGEKPLTGHGLFTFGKGLQRLNSMPPISPHSHAHNLPLNVLAELGLVGFAALALSIALALWAIRRNWQQAAGERERAILIAGIAASVGFGVHHLFDAPLLMPAIALAGLLATVVAVAPIKPVPMVWRWRALGHGLALAGSGVLLIVSGGWSSRVYTHYTEIVAYGLSSRDYVGAAQQLESILDADPAMPMYHWQQGIFYGVDAYVNASAESANASAAAFERYLMLEPQNAVAWANLGALRRQLGSTTAAQDAFARATALAPESWQLAVIEARAGQGENAAAAYRRALAIEPALILLPEVAALGLDITTPLDGLTAVVERSLDGDVAGAAALWDSAPIQTVPGYAVRAVLALETGEREAGLAYLAEGDARLYSDDTPNLAWVRWAQARFDGDNPDAARRLITPDLFDPDYVNGINLAWAQFLRDVTPRLFLPQVDYAISDVLLIALLQPG
jgi:tetratricopeptide (TPR) repeat protein